VVRLELNGTAIAPGVGVGTIVLLLPPASSTQPRRVLAEGEQAAALKLFARAHARALARLAEVQDATAQELGLQDAAIYAAQAAVLQDPEALQEIQQGILKDRLAPESAIQSFLDRLGGIFEALEGGDMKSWAADLRDPWMQVLHELGEGTQDAALAAPGHHSLILVAEELTPSLLTRFPRARVAGILCARGGRFSHGAMVARATGLPVVAGLDQIHLRALAGETCVLYGDEGRALLGVAPAEMESARERAAGLSRMRERLATAALAPCVTRDGTPVDIQANIESPRDLEIFNLGTVDGIGLFRTEFAYMERPSFPSAEEQTRLYSGVLQSLKGRPVTFRTLDVGADKQLRYLTLPKEANPALGWRGLRLGLVWQDILLLQLQAFLASGAHGQVRILLPMVTTVEELLAVKKLLLALPVVGGQRPLLGAMIEVPAAVIGLGDLLREADFVSVGTNDLTQYLFAVDRDNPWVSSLYQPYHPAHLRVLRMIARQCVRSRKPFAVCGEMAGQAAGALFLVGAGFRSLSMAATFVPEIKALLRASDAGVLRTTAHRAMRCRTAGEASAILDTAVAQAWERVAQAGPEAGWPGAKIGI
jgi:phosphotransferase system enzyme I (PtsI)